MNHFKLSLTLTLLLSIFIHATVTLAHETSTAYLTAKIDNKGLLQGELQVRLFDLEQAIGLDPNNDGELTWAEALSKSDDVDAYLHDVLSFQRNENTCSASFKGAWQLDRHFNAAYLVLPISAQCALDGDLTINYDGFFDAAHDHKLLVSLATQDGNINRVISQNTRVVSINTQKGNRWETFKEFTKQGAIHIWIGLDHILFLMCLLLAVVFVSKNKDTEQANTLREVGLKTLLVVTAFTLAHSITLAATALGWLNFSSTWVEVGIAVSVLFAAVNNVFPVVRKIALITFGFGLLHGMGFAGVLGELGLPSDQKLLSILAFNLGVEFGQLLIILIALPLMYLIKKYNLKPHYFLVGGSGIIALIAIIWIIERLPV